MSAQQKTASASAGGGVVAGIIAVGIIVVLGFVGWYFGLSKPADQIAGSSQQLVGKQAREAMDEAAGKAAGKDGSTGKAAPGEGTAAPSFGTVRVEAGGDAVLAGRAEPGSKVELFANSQKIGEAVAGPGGDWAMVLDKPLAKGASDIWITAEKSGQAKIRSRQSVAVVIDPDGKRQPLVVVQDDGGSKVVEQPRQVAARDGEKPGEAGGQPAGKAAEKPPVSIEAADYDTSGKLHISGKGAPSTTVRVYFDDIHVGDATADETGQWSLSTERPLDGAVHSVRADEVGEKTGTVTARAEVSFIAELPEADKQAMAQKQAEMAEQAQKQAEKQAQEQAQQAAAAAAQGEGAGQGPDRMDMAKTDGKMAEQKPAGGKMADDAMATGEQKMAAASPDAPPANGSGKGTGKGPGGKLTVVRGDNLWRISRKYYGRGVRYTAIFQANTDQIRNPHLIYPGQVFLIPRLQDSPESGK